MLPDMPAPTSPHNSLACTEGSHATFAPRGWKQRALQAHVEQERGHCSVERVSVVPAGIVDVLSSCAVLWQTPACLS